MKHTKEPLCEGLGHWQLWLGKRLFKATHGQTKTSWLGSEVVWAAVYSLIAVGLSVSHAFRKIAFYSAFKFKDLLRAGA